MLEVAARCFHVVLIRMISASVQKPKWGVPRKDICGNRAGRAAPYGQVREMPKGSEESRPIMFVSESFIVLPKSFTNRWESMVFFKNGNFPSIFLVLQF